MGAILASVTIQRVQTTLLDEASTPGGLGVTWNLAANPGELLDYYNASVRLIGLHQPDTITRTQMLAQVGGARQTVAGTFVKATSNAAGRAITPVDMDDMDHMLPDWRTTQAGPTQHYIADNKDSAVYWVYPPAVPGAMVEITRILSPAPVALGDANPIDDDYEPVIFWLVMAHAYAKNAKRGDTIKMSQYLTLARQGLGINDPGQIRLQPRPVAQEQANG